MPAHYDFILAGGGCAGLLLAYELLHSPLADRSILIIDRDDKDQNDRTWAYWSDRPSPFEAIMQRRWTTLRFAGADAPPPPRDGIARHPVRSGGSLLSEVEGRAARSQEVGGRAHPSAEGASAAPLSRRPAQNAPTHTPVILNGVTTQPTVQSATSEGSALAAMRFFAKGWPQRVLSRRPAQNDSPVAMTSGMVGTLNTGDWHYAMIRGDDFYRHIRGLLAAQPNVTWLKAAVKRIEDDETGATVWLDPDGPGDAEWQACHGTWVFDSLFNIHRFEPDTTRYRYLKQCFKGWFIETPEDAFDPDEATIFDFRTPQAGEMRFFYLLPTSPRAALVEYVGLSEVDYDALLNDYVRGVLGIEKYTIVSDETGTTPLTDAPFPRRTGRHIMTTGIQGGLVKPTSGYAYTRILNDSAAIVRSLLTHGHPFDVPATKPLYRWLDSVMLEVMRVEPERLSAAFTAMFARNPAPRIFRFLDERASLADIVGLVLTLPKWPFLRGAGRLVANTLKLQRTQRAHTVEVEHT